MMAILRIGMFSKGTEYRGHGGRRAWRRIPLGTRIVFANRIKAKTGDPREGARLRCTAK